MQWKNVFCAVVIFSPFGVFAQKNTKPVTDGKQLALLDESMKDGNVIIAAGSKIVQPDSLITHQITEPEQTAVATTTAAKKKSEKKFKPVPLIGQLDYYGKMNNYMIRYCKSYMSNFSRRLNNVNSKDRIFAVMDDILTKYGIPTELKYLAVIESALNANARSPVGAVGYWQFMAPTARRMGLTVNRHRDDRKNLYKSTAAAARYLSYLYGVTDDWLLTVAAYNSGLRPVLRAIDRTGKHDFWSIKKYLPKETQNHVLAFVATATIMERLNPYIEEGLPSNFDWSTLSGPPPTPSEIAEAKYSGHKELARFSKSEIQKMAIIRIKQPLNLEVVASTLSIDRDILKKWNYDYYTFAANYSDGDTYNLRIPKDKLDGFIEKLGELQNARLPHQFQ